VGQVGGVRAESAADWVCASTRGRLVSTPLNRGTVLTARLLSASSKMVSGTAGKMVRGAKVKRTQEGMGRGR
jgi:hypothetical protein